MDLESFLPRILPRVPGVAFPVALDAVRLASEQFCERTRLWRCDDTLTLSGDPEEQMVSPSGSVIHEVTFAKNDEGAALEPITLQDLDRRYSDEWRTLTASAPRYMTQEEPDKLRFVPMAESGTVTVQMVLKPAPDATQVPDWLYNQHARVIADGALAELFSAPGTDYSNPQLAGFHGQKFQSKLDELAAKGLKGQQRAPLRTRARFI